MHVIYVPLHIYIEMYLAGERVEAEQSHGVAKHVTPLFVMSRLSLAELRLQLMLMVSMRQQI